MSAKGKVPAFAVFKHKKATSLTNVADQTPKGPDRKSSSANTTPTGSTQKISNSITNLFNKITQSEKKKAKSDLKKAKKLLKDETKSSKPMAVLPESALHSPIITSKEIKSLRPKTNTPTRNYQLPLKATSDMVSNLQYKETYIGTPDGSQAPPRPPRGSRHDSQNSSPLANGMASPPLSTKGSKKRTSSKADMSVTPPPIQPRTSVSPAAKGANPSARSMATRQQPTNESAKGVDEPEGALVPAKPAKRRRLSQGSAPPSPQQATSSATFGKTHMISPGGTERREPIPEHPSQRISNMPYMFNSGEEARKLFECLIHPVKPDKFFQELWEKKPLLVKRHMPQYNDGWFSCTEMDCILRENTLNFGENLDVVEYVNGKRETHNPPGRAYAPVVWDYYQNGCSVRILNPHTYSRNIWKLLSILQEYFGCMTGANIYLTPPGTQGFAPHYDDIEAFIIQLEGKKHWRLYSPRTENETLPKFSSLNFTDTNIGEPILDTILEAGDLLYFPRGTIHQGKTLYDAHSLHITVSCMQQNTWGDLLERIVPGALRIAFEEDIEFRKSLPKEYLNYMGVAYSDKDYAPRQQFLRKVEQLMSKLLTYAPVDAAVDQMAKKFIHDSLPPVFTEQEKQCSINGTGEHWSAEQGRVIGATELHPDDKVKIIRKGCIRIVKEDNDDMVSIYHNLENARVYHGKDIQFIEVSSDFAPGVEYLLHQYPNFSKVDDIPLDNVQDRVELASALYDKGLLLTSKPLDPISDEESSCESEEDMDSNVENQLPPSSKKSQPKMATKKAKTSVV